LKVQQLKLAVLLYTIIQGKRIRSQQMYKKIMLKPDENTNKVN